MMIQLELSEEENMIVDVWKAMNKLKNKKDAIKAIILEHKLI